jgi:hypothetical protein
LLYAVAAVQELPQTYFQSLAARVVALLEVVQVQHHRQRLQVLQVATQAVAPTTVQAVAELEALVATRQALQARRAGQEKT